MHVWNFIPTTYPNWPTFPVQSGNLSTLGILGQTAFSSNAEESSDWMGCHQVDSAAGLHLPRPDAVARTHRNGCPQFWAWSSGGCQCHILATLIVLLDKGTRIKRSTRLSRGVWTTVAEYRGGSQMQPHDNNARYCRIQWCQTASTSIASLVALGLYILVDLVTTCPWLPATKQKY